MCKPDTPGFQALRVLADVGERINEFTVKLRLGKHAEVSDLSPCVCIRCYQSGPAFEWYVECTLPNKAEICWSYEIFLDEAGYRVEAAISTMVRGNQETLREWNREGLKSGEVFSRTADELCRELLSFTPDKIGNLLPGL